MTGPRPNGWRAANRPVHACSFLVRPVWGVWGDSLGYSRADVLSCPNFSMVVGVASEPWVGAWGGDRRRARAGYRRSWGGRVGVRGQYWSAAGPEFGAAGRGPASPRPGGRVGAPGRVRRATGPWAVDRRRAPGRGRTQRRVRAPGRGRASRPGPEAAARARRGAVTPRRRPPVAPVRREAAIGRVRRGATGRPRNRRPARRPGTDCARRAGRWRTSATRPRSAWCRRLSAGPGPAAGRPVCRCGGPARLDQRIGRAVHGGSVARAGQWL